MTQTHLKHQEEYLREPTGGLIHPVEPDNYWAPDYQADSLQLFQPDDVIVRPPSPDIDYNFQELGSPRGGNLSMILLNYIV